ncbi:MAG: glycosyltransferase [Mycobacteriales bacterium]|nr:glycosyltransferase [Mycobacteriales bacterium]
MLARYAQLSQTFVDGEISEQRRRGSTVPVLALRRGDRDLGDDPRVTYLEDVPDDWPQVFRHNLAALLRHPLGYSTFLRRVRLLRTEMGRSRPELLRWWRLPGVATELRSQGVRVLHAHFAWSGAAAAACLSPLLGAPWSMTVHANDIHARRRNLEVKLALADQVVTVCRYNLEALPGTRSPVRVLTCGITLPQEAPQVERDLDLVCVGRLIAKKGVDLAVEAVGQLRDRGIATTLHVVGDGPLRSALDEQVTRAGLQDHICFHGALPHEEVLGLVGRAKVLCLPCRVAPDGDRDAMPTVLVEAMARGVPVVSTDIGGIPEMVDADVGRLVPPEQVDALADALAELLTDAPLRERLGNAGRVRAAERFDVRQQTATLAEWLQELATR